MMSKLTQDNSMPGRAERQRIRERAELVVAEARVLREHLDRTWGAMSVDLPATSLPAVACSLEAPGSRHLQVG